MNIFGSIAKSKVAKILFVVFGLVFFEFVSKAIVYFLLGIEGDTYARYYQNDPKLSLITWTESYTPHPYFGYESLSTRTAETILSEVGSEDFVIGILGGSVAGSFAEYSIRNKSQFEPLRKVIPAFGTKNLQIVNLANGGYKQPQQFFVAAYFSDKLDLVINLDGLNDAQPAHLLPVYPLEFPNFPRYGRVNQGGFYVSLGRSARWVYKGINSVPLAIPGLSGSSLYFICWYNLHDVLYRVVKASESAYYAKEFGVHQSENLRNTPPKEFIRRRIEIWKKYTILEDDLVRKRTGKAAFFFLQPNQYVKGSKPFSDEEKRIAFDPALMESQYEMMLFLKEGVHDLHSLKIPIFDLTTIFGETNETVYKDACCHVNDLGNRIMTNAILSHIAMYERPKSR